MKLHENRSLKDASPEKSADVPFGLSRLQCDLKSQLGSKKCRTLFYQISVYIIEEEAGSDLIYITVNLE